MTALLQGNPKSRLPLCFYILIPLACFDSKEFPVGVRFRQFSVQLHINSSISMPLQKLPIRFQSTLKLDFMKIAGQ